MRYPPAVQSRSSVFSAIDPVISPCCILVGGRGAGGRRGQCRPTAGSSGPPARSAVLHLTDGSFAAGASDDSSGPGVLRWRAAGFVAPFEFAVNRVNAIHWPPPAVLPKPSGDFCFELAGGDVLFGSLTALNDKEAELDVPATGRLHVQRSGIHRIFRWARLSAGPHLSRRGPNGLGGWQEAAPPRPAAATTVVIRNGINGQPRSRSSLKPLSKVGTKRPVKS